MTKYDIAKICIATLITFTIIQLNTNITKNWLDYFSITAIIFNTLLTLYEIQKLVVTWNTQSETY